MSVRFIQNLLSCLWSTESVSVFKSVGFSDGQLKLTMLDGSSGLHISEHISEHS
jgi:hypothetical protein